MEWYFGDCVYEGKTSESSTLTKTKRPLFLLMTSCINDLEIGERKFQILGNVFDADEPLLSKILI